MGPLGVSSMGQHLPLLNSTRAYGLAMNLLASGLRGKSKGSGGTPQVPFTSALRGLTTNKKMMIPLKRPKKYSWWKHTYFKRCGTLSCAIRAQHTIHKNLISLIRGIRLPSIFMSRFLTQGASTWDFDVMRRVTGDPWPFHACQQGSMPSTTSHHLQTVSNLLQWAWGTWRGSIWCLHKMRLYLVTLGSSTGSVLSSSQHEGDKLSVLW